MKAQARFLTLHKIMLTIKCQKPSRIWFTATRQSEYSQQNTITKHINVFKQ